MFIHKIVLPIPVAPATTPITTPKPIHIRDPSDIDPPHFPLPPSPLTISVARKSKSFKHRKSFEATISEKLSTFGLQNKIDEPITSASPGNRETYTDFTFETFTLLYLKLSSSLFSTFSADGFLNSSFITSTFPPKKQPFSYYSRSRAIQTSSFSRTRSTSRSISALLRQHAQLYSSTSDSFLPLSVIFQPSLRPSFGIELFFTVPSYKRSCYLLGDQESVSSLSSFIIAQLAYRSPDKTSCHPTLDPNQYPLRLDNKIHYPRQSLRCHILPVLKITNILQYSTFTRNPEMTRSALTTAKQNIEVTVRFIGLNSRPIPISTQIKHRTFSSPSVVTSSHFTPTDEPPFDHRGGSKTLYNPFSGLKYKTIFGNVCFLFSVILDFSLLETVNTIISASVFQHDDPGPTQLLVTHEN